MVTDHEMRMEGLRLFEENERLTKALQSIANNTCCGGCQEAAKVAINALAGLKLMSKGAAGDHGQVGWMGGDPFP